MNPASAKLTACEGRGDSVVALDQRWQLGIDENSFFYLQVSVDDTQVDIRRLAEEERGQRVVHRTSSQVERI